MSTMTKEKGTKVPTTTTKRRKARVPSTARAASRRDVAIDRLTAIAEDRTAKLAAERKATARMYAGMLKAHTAGLTYDEIATITGLSRIRVSQVLSEQRAAQS